MRAALIAFTVLLASTPAWATPRQDLDRALATLPEHYRTVVILSDLEEFNYAEIAGILDIPVGTVRSRLARARGALQKLLWQQAREYGIRDAGPSGQMHEKKGNA